MTVEDDRAPFVGVLRRMWAFLLDCILLYLAGSALERVGRPALTLLNPALPWVGFLLGFVYFWLGNGPLGRGRTVGKLIMHLQAVDAQGQPLTLGPAFRRALVQQVGLLVYLGLNPAYATLFLPVNMRMGAALFLMIMMLICLSWLLALAVSVGVHPYKRGWHDAWAGSYVTFAPAPPSFRNAFQTPPDAITQGRLNKHKLITLGFWIAATLALLIYPLRSITAPEMLKHNREIIDLQQRLQLRPYVLTQVFYPDAAMRRQALEYVAQIRADQARAVARQQQPGYISEKKQIVETTATLLSKAILDGETILTLALRAHGPFSAGDLDDAGFRAQIEQLRRILWENFQREPAGAEGKAKAQRFTLLLYEPFQLFFNSNNEWRGRISGPADPQAGPLKYEVLPPKVRILGQPEPTPTPTVQSVAAEAVTTETHAATQTTTTLPRR
jgi:uncharacterized RDD family membrane protein YckC